MLKSTLQQAGHGAGTLADYDISNMTHFSFSDATLHLFFSLLGHKAVTFVYVHGRIFELVTLRIRKINKQYLTKVIAFC